MHHQETPISPSIKVVLFDHDDTLVGSIKAKWAQHKFIARTFYDKKLTDEDIQLHWGKPFTVLLKLLYGTDHIDMAMSYNIATRSKFPKVLFKDTIKTLSALHQSGKKLALVTATTRSSLNYDFETLKIPDHLFDFIQTEDETIFHKPDPRVFEPVLKWIAEQQIQPHEVLCVGDQLTDMHIAKEVGFEFIGVGTGLISVEEFEKHQVRAVPRIGHLVKTKQKITEKIG
jgi:phosphoglycolate phosphatase